MKKLVLFYNPVSGHAAFKNKLDWIVEAFQRRGILVVFYRTRREGNEAFIPFVREVNPDGLLVAGGDGTVHEIVNLMMKGNLDLPLGIIGSGTSNDFATYLGVNTDLEAYLDTIASGRTPTFIRELGDRFRPNAPIIAMNGAMICDENDGHVLRRFPMSRDVLEIMDDIAATGLPRRMSLWNEYEIRDDWTREDGVLPSARFKSLPEPWFKTVITADPESTLKIRDYFLARYAERFNCGRSWPEGFEIHSLESGKGECMRALREMYGGRIHTTVGVGDYENDVTLIRMADIDRRSIAFAQSVLAQLRKVNPLSDHEGTG